MVGVYDPVSGLNGYINLQDTTWAPYDATLGAVYDLGTANPDSTLGGDGADNDKPVTSGWISNATLTLTNATNTFDITVTQLLGTVPKIGQTVANTGATAYIPASTTITGVSFNSGTSTYTITISNNIGSGGGSAVVYAYTAYTNTAPHTSYVGQVGFTNTTSIQVFNSNIKKDSIVLYSISATAAPAANYISAQTNGDLTLSPPQYGSFTVTFASASNGLLNYQIIN
jgi:hypothetical protein